MVPVEGSRGAIAGMFWRLLVASDGTVDRFVVRDVDSSLGAREKAAVDEWIALGEAWFGSPVATRHRLGEGSGVYVTEMAKWETGQAALVTVSDGAPAIDLMLIGSRGTLYHEM